MFIEMRGVGLIAVYGPFKDEIEATTAFYKAYEDSKNDDEIMHPFDGYHDYYLCSSLPTKIGYERTLEEGHEEIKLLYDPVYKQSYDPMGRK